MEGRGQRCRLRHIRSPRGRTASHAVDLLLPAQLAGLGRVWQGQPRQPYHTAPAPASAADQFNEQVARGLDFLLAEASKYGIKATIAFLNLWKPSGVPLFEKW